MSDDGVSTTEAMKTLVGLLKDDDEFKRSLGANTATFILMTVAIAATELAYGLPAVTLASAPLYSATTTFLIGAVKSHLRSGRPDIVFFCCPNIECPRPNRYFRIKWSDLPKFRKFKTCSACGVKLRKRCPSGRHFIVSPSTEDPRLAPDAGALCPFCDDSTPASERRYIPEAIDEPAA